MTPLYQTGAFGYSMGMFLAVLLGIGFGFTLERAGFGRAKTLVAQFYGDDMRVFKVMFSAIVTTTIGLGVLGGVGVVDLSLLVTPGTWLVPAIVGGTLLGIGFVVAGYCPGTALVAAGSGHLDGILALVGIMGGSLLFGFLYDPLEGLYEMTSWGKINFVDVLGVAWPVLALGVAVMAIGGFFAAEWAERYFAKRQGSEAPQDSPMVRNRVFGGLIGASALGLMTLALPLAQAAPSAPLETAPITALALADAVTAGHGDLYIVDLRSPEVCKAERVRGAMCLSAEDPKAEFLATLTPTRALVLYGAGPGAKLPESASRFGNEVFVLDGGFAAWRSTVLTRPAPPTNPTPAAVQDYEHRSAMHQYFTGSKAPPAPIMARPTAVRQAAKKGGGC